LRCASCKRALMAMPRKRGRLYGCRSHGCERPSMILGNVVEEYVFGELIYSGLADAPALAELVSQAEGEEQRDANELLARKAEAEAKREEWKQAVRDGLFRPNELAHEINPLNAIIRDCDNKLATLSGGSALSRLTGHVAERWGEMAAEDQKAILRVLVSSIDLRRAAVPGSMIFDPERLEFHWVRPTIEKLAGQGFTDRVSKESFLADWYAANADQG
jgi:hypothetical protein